MTRQEQGWARRSFFAAVVIAACVSSVLSCSAGGDGAAGRVGTVELAASGTCPVTINVPAQNQAVGQYIQIQVTQSCSNWTNSMIAYIDDQRCDQAPYPFPNAGCFTTGGAQNFSTSTWVKVTPGTHHIVVNNWNAQGVVGVSSSVTFSYSPPVLAGAGDIACNGPDRSIMPCNDPATGATLAGINPTWAFTLGDNQYENGEIGNYQTYYGASWGIPALLGKTRPVVGNHEYNGNANYTGCHTSTANFCTASAYMQANYYTYFNSELSGVDPNKNGWYSYDVPTPYGQPWHVVVLNGAICDPSSYPSECPDPSTCWSNASNCSTSSTQYGWLVNDLATFRTQHPNAHCLLAMWHEPRFSSGEHGSNSTFQPFWQALYNEHAEIILNGHDHNYEHFDPQTPSGGSDPAHGIVQFTVGTGGRDDTGCNALQPNSRLCVSNTYGVLKLTLHDGSADYVYVNSAGNTVNDSGTIVCHD